ncbi:MAG: hypothetical protein ACU83N_13160 [Gammaproteobacteria bacterium]
MIGGIVMILVVLWVYHSAVQAKVDKVLFWVVVCAAVFLTVQFLAVQMNIYLLESLKGDIGSDYERSIASIGDRKNQSGFQGFFGALLSVFLELMPPALGVLAVAFVKTKFILKQELKLANLFSGMKETFLAIKESFKTSS